MLPIMKSALQQRIAGRHARGDDSISHWTKLGVISIAIVFLSIHLFPLLRSPLHGDDLPNSMLRGSLQISGVSFWQHVIQSTFDWWNNEGRFFPMAILEGSAVFYLFDEIWTYKLFQFSIVVILVLLLAQLITPISLRPSVWLCSVLCIASSLQFRNWYDPIIGFAAMIPSSSIKVVGVLLLLRMAAANDRKARKRAFIVTATILWFFALTQYETTTAFAPSLLLAHKLGSSSKSKSITPDTVADAPRPVSRLPLLKSTWMPGAILFAATVVYVAGLFLLRPQVNAAPAYTPTLTLNQFVPAYMKQFSGGVPFSWLVAGIELDRPPILMASLLVIITTASMLAMIHGIQRSEIPDVPILWPTALMSLNFIIAAPISSAVSQRWQQELRVGYGYINVFYQYIGFGVLLSVIIQICLFKGRGTPRRQTVSAQRKQMKSPLLASVLTLIIVVLTVTGHSLLGTVTSAMRPSNVDRNNVIEALRPGGSVAVLATDMEGEGVMPVVTSKYDPNLFLNTTFFHIHGGDQSYVVFRDLDSCGELCRNRYIELEFTLLAQHEGDNTPPTLTATLKQPPPGP